MAGHKFKELIPKTDYTLEDVAGLLNKDLQYASMGRYGIYHILRHIKTENEKVMMPIYACDSIAAVIKKAGYYPVYYDISEEDLNGTVDTIKKCHDETKSDILIIPSLYGNPADLVAIEKYCKDEKIYMIDDAAQCFGAKYEGKFVGTYGNAGLFSFSAGKPTYGHMGCFFWCDKSIKIKRTRHSIIHWLRYIDFFYNRYGNYNATRLYRVALLNYINIFLGKVFKIENDDICEFEKNILPSIVFDNINNLKERRFQYMEQAKELFKNSDFRIVTSRCGEANNNKLVLVAKSSQIAIDFINILHNYNIHCSKGYKLLDRDVNTPVAQDICSRIIEVPILISPYVNKCEISQIDKALKEYNRRNCYQ